MDIAKIVARFIEEEQVFFSHHARIRMFERNISSDDVLAVIKTGDILEEYLDADPCWIYHGYTAPPCTGTL